MPAHEMGIVDQREYGELIATVKHLAGSIESLQQQQAAADGKLHERLSEISRCMVPRREHDVLREDVNELWKYSRKTRGMLNTSSATTREGMRWQEKMLYTGMGALITLMAVAAKIIWG